jgi:hypothetical protein
MPAKRLTVIAEVKGPGCIDCYGVGPASHELVEAVADWCAGIKELEAHAKPAPAPPDPGFWTLAKPGEVADHQKEAFNANVNQLVLRIVLIFIIGAVAAAFVARLTGG